MLEKKMTLNDLKAKKGKEKIAAITAYDALMAKIFVGVIQLNYYLMLIHVHIV